MTEENINQEPIVEAAASEAPQPAETVEQPVETVDQTADWEKRYKDVQTWANQISEENATLKNQIESINPKLDLVDRLAGVFDQNQDQNLSIEDRINQSLPRLEEQYDSLVQTLEQERAEKNQILQYLNAQKQEADYNRFVEEYRPLFSTEDDFKATENALLEKFPNIVEDVQTGRRPLDSFMKEYLGEQLSDPNSTVRKSMESARNNQQLQKQFNHLSSSASIPGAGEEQQAWNPIRIMPAE